MILNLIKLKHPSDCDLIVQKLILIIFFYFSIITGLKDIFKETQFLTNLKNFASNTVSYQVDSKLSGKPATQSVAGKYIPYNKDEM